MDINLPEVPESLEKRIPGLFKVIRPFPRTTRRIHLGSKYVNLGTKHKSYHFSPSLENINDHIKRSPYGYCVICFPEKDILYIMSLSDAETEGLFQKLMAGDRETDIAFTENYVKQFKRLVSRNYIVGDGEKVLPIFEWEDNE
jgi:hypothetical protein